MKPFETAHLILRSKSEKHTLCSLIFFVEGSLNEVSFVRNEEDSLNTSDLHAEWLDNSNPLQVIERL